MPPVPRHVHRLDRRRTTQGLADRAARSRLKLPAPVILRSGGMGELREHHRFHDRRHHSLFDRRARLSFHPASLGAALDLGGYVSIDREDAAPFLGQILDIEVQDAGGGLKRIAGRGEIRAVTDGTRILDEIAGAPSAPRVCRRPIPRSSFTISGKRGARRRASRSARCRRLSGDQALPRFRPAGFGRHTLVCGQSGSGKTYCARGHPRAAVAGNEPPDRRARSRIPITWRVWPSCRMQAGWANGCDRPCRPVGPLLVRRSAGCRCTARAPVKSRFTARASADFPWRSRRWCSISIRSAMPGNTTCSSGSSARSAARNTPSAISASGRVAMLDDGARNLCNPDREPRRGRAGRLGPHGRAPR